MSGSSPSPVVLFDFDDTIASTRAAWSHARMQLHRARGASPGESRALEEVNGLSARDLVARLQSGSPAALSLEQTRDAFDSALIAHYQRHGLPPKPGALAVLDRLAGRARLGIASGSSRKVLLWALRRLGIEGAFECAVSSEEVAEGKPSPLVFLEAARRLRASPGACVVVEDSLIGVQAALAAGMACIAVPSREEESAAIGSLASRRLSSLEACDFETVAALFPVR